ncbi:TPA-induced transmembrane protein [Esox lucius]|uniref:SEA domain-containing protein n=1 Tax=Esox lucius TaxID=8010 RepID=A0A3P8Z7C2_ESOLU|nr:TPA-induced transmembrane protein [Esox lucius]
MNVDIELQDCVQETVCNGHHDEYAMDQIRPGNSDRLTNNTHEPMEEQPLLNPVQDPVSEVGHHNTSLEVRQDNTTVCSEPAIGKTCAAHRLRKRLNAKVLGNLRLWGVILILIFLIAAVIGASIVFCSVIHKDLDETYDSSLFVLPLCFNGSFQLTNQVFTPELLSPASNQSRFLSSQLKQKLTVLYSSSPALGRYFSSAGISSFRNGSVIVDYWLRFLVPVDNAELQRFTLSREMVLNVFRQSVYDQEPETEHPLDILPSSLDMQVARGAGDSESAASS